MTMLPTRQPGTKPVPAAVEYRAVGEIAVLDCTGDLDLAALEAMETAVCAALETRPVGLVLDLTGVPFCDTVGLRLLLSCAAKACAQGCAIAVAGVQPAVADFLRRVCADRVLPAYAGVSEAIEGLMFSATWR